MDELQLGDDPIADPLDLGKPSGGGRNHVGEGSEPLQQRLGDRLHIAARNGTKQNQFQHLVIGERVCAHVAKAGAQALPVAVKMRRLGKSR